LIFGIIKFAFRGAYVNGFTWTLGDKLNILILDGIWKWEVGNIHSIVLKQAQLGAHPDKPLLVGKDLIDL
jgi:hypothetical protein